MRVYYRQKQGRDKERNRTMEKTIIRNTLINFYNETSATHNYIVAFNYKGNIIAVETTSETLFNTGVKLDKAGRGQGYSIRFKPNNSEKVALMTGKTTVLCSTEYFEATVKASKYNKGEILEKMVTEYFGQTWTKDNVPYTEDGDITVNGVKYQIKFEKATFINESQMVRMRG